jgi:hypothetical protein
MSGTTDGDSVEALTRYPNRLAAGVADTRVRSRHRTRDSLVLGTFLSLIAVACGSSDGTTNADPGARTPEQITAELNVTAADLGESWEESDREPFESAELLPQCHLDNEVDATIQTVEFENAREELGALQLVGVFDPPADASALMDLWYDDPYTCIDENVVVTELDFELGDADEAVRLVIGFSDVPQTIRQEVAVVRYGDTVVIALANSGSDVDPASIEMLLQEPTGHR